MNGIDRMKSTILKPTSYARQVQNSLKTVALLLFMCVCVCVQWSVYCTGRVKYTNDHEWKYRILEHSRGGHKSTRKIITQPPSRLRRKAIERRDAARRKRSADGKFNKRQQALQTVERFRSVALRCKVVSVSVCLCVCANFC